MKMKRSLPKLSRNLVSFALLGAAIPEQYGGGGFGEVGYCLMQEEISRACLSTATFIGAHQSIGTNAILIGGSEAVKQKYVVPLAQGEKDRSILPYRSSGWF